MVGKGGLYDLYEYIAHTGRLYDSCSFEFAAK